MPTCKASFVSFFFFQGGGGILLSEFFHALWQSARHFAETVRSRTALEGVLCNERRLFWGCRQAVFLCVFLLLASAKSTGCLLSIFKCCSSPITFQGRQGRGRGRGSLPGSWRERERVASIRRFRIVCAGPLPRSLSAGGH